MRPESARSVHRRLKSAVAEWERAETNVVTLFAEVLRRKLYQELGYGTVYLYAAAELPFSAGKTSQPIRLAESLESLPKLKQAVSDGAVPWTTAREVARVATKDTEAVWIGVAKRSSRRDLEVTIAETRAEAKAARRSDPAQAALPRGAAPGRSAPRRGRHAAEQSVPVPAPQSLPVGVSLRFTPEEYARFQALVEAVRKKGVTGSREALLLAALEDCAAAKTPTGSGPTRPPYQVTVTLCPACGSAHVPSSRGAVPLDAPAKAAVLSDCERIERDHRKRSAIPTRVRRRVLERGGHRCRAPGCTNTRFLEIDHILPVEAGGTNDPDNLRVLCSGCHRVRHRTEHRTRHRRESIFPGENPARTNARQPRS